MILVQGSSDSESRPCGKEEGDEGDWRLLLAYADRNNKESKGAGNGNGNQEMTIFLMSSELSFLLQGAPLKTTVTKILDQGQVGNNVGLLGYRVSQDLLAGALIGLSMA
ncbi:putative elongation factor tu [Corchorus olitorius]|uniref:Elongation factor tu n=1 Tax=Corchorus olitorius TaxID=93759 RepID=A0A1R3GXI2_9ROSI|nr:putative elongation factor tu [Corchorus olitorius]